jgi:hypothetical protein
LRPAKIARCQGDIDSQGFLLFGTTLAVCIADYVKSLMAWMSNKTARGGYTMNGNNVIALSATEISGR